MQYLVVVALSILACRWATAQPAVPPYVYVNQITLEGNKKTRDNIILRELLFAEGDTLPVDELPRILERSEQLILNTGLFNNASIVFKNWEGITNRVHLHIKVEETWYLYPVPVFELADRNFNVWWVEQGRSLSRVNYGIEFTHLNTSGRRDRLKLILTHGYTHRYGLNYSLPFFNRKQTLGLVGDVSFFQNKEVNYLTSGNKQAFYREDNGFIYDRFRAEIGLTVRPGLRTNHLFALGYFHNQVGEKVALELNPDFFLNGRTRQQFFSLIYRYDFENRDARFFPWRGSYFTFVLEKAGLGIFEDRNALTTWLRFDHHLAFSDRWSLGLSFRGKTSLIRQRQPYVDYRALGYNSNTPHGYEYYVVDGLDLGLVMSSLHWLLTSMKVNFGRAMPIKAFREMPVKFYLSLNNDFGYVNDPYASPDNFLHNSPLWGSGLGLDIVLFYNKVIRIEYSFNHLLENGLFLHLDFNI